ncbi:Hypothetical protein PHPALM_36126, partial [Phytophthora palmivora]
ALLVARATQLGVDVKRLDGGNVLSDAELWTKANEILKRSRGSDESVSVAWVHRFKRRHGLHRSQLKRAAEAAVAESVEVLGSVEDVTSDAEPARKRVATATRSHFVSSDDILLLTHVLEIKPWTFPYVMDGWQLVVEKLRVEETFRLEKTAGACQARLNLLLGHMKAGNSMALRKAGTEEELDRKCALVAEVAAQIEVHESAQKGNDTSSIEAVEVIPPANSDGMPDLTRERERIAQRRLELMERKMERELAAQKRHSEEQVSRLEKLHREQQKIQQEQHAQLLTTIQQQQAMMSDLIKSLAPTTSSGNATQDQRNL